ncbi:hypothetical protein SRABI98_00733 [Microbacterium sp. Bi98]|uniref:hypothetical protein n=1 Tax=Microbacterium sp. Bi98 TaxID=2821116 RepID=UPI001DA98237|nr:hypothetical protein [Microbacterium sp. Bi98]CAH0148793.1 hypothetical protein SRABI98_00733 [Microbacterium sp. Bi98]
MTTSTGRLRALVAMDGRVAHTMSAVFQYFIVSISFLGCFAPAAVFTITIGWQPTHLAIWAASASLLPLLPATFALLCSTRVLITDPVDAHAGRVFWVAFIRGCRSLVWAAAGLSAIVLVLNYDLALFHDSHAMLLFIAGAAAVLAVLVIAICVVAAAETANGAISTLSLAMRAVARRPHIALSWLLLIGLGAGIASLPLIGAPVALFLPALLGAAIHICNDALRLPVIDEMRTTP